MAWASRPVGLIKITAVTLVNVYQSKKGDKDQESIQSSTAPDQDTTLESDKNTTRAKRSALSQQVTTRQIADNAVNMRGN